MSLQDKIAAILAESAVPGTDAILGTKQSEELKGAESVTGDNGDNTKMTSKYDKGTKQPKLDEPAKSGETDSKASEETNKMTKDYQTTTQGKLKAEAIEALFAGEDLTEGFKVKAEAIFEAAVEQAAEAKVQALQEEYQQQLDEAVAEVKGELVEQIDGYLDHVVEEWVQDNAVALESGVKAEIYESLMLSLKQVFEAHNIEIPESKVDLVAEQASQIEEMQVEINALQEAADLALSEAKLLRCEAIVAEALEGLTAIEAEKLKNLAEEVSFDTEEEFAAKVAALKESYFRKGPTEVVSEAQDNPATIVEKKVHDDVNAVLNVLRTPDAFKVIRSSN